MFAFCSVMVETLSEAKAHGWAIAARCAWGRREGMKSVRECVSRYVLDLDALIWTRGAEFPLSMLAERLSVRVANRGEWFYFSIDRANLRRSEPAKGEYPGAGHGALYGEFDGKGLSG